MHVILDDNDVKLVIELLSRAKDVRSKDLIDRLKTASEDTKITRELRKEAMSQSKDGELEVDEGAVVSIVDPQEEADGAYVQAWLWVYKPEKVESQPG
jgi:hypothetical protein